MKPKIWAALFFILAGILNLTRMIPFYAGNEAENLPDFPFTKASEIATFVSSNFTGHAISHVMALISFILLIAGLLLLVTMVKEDNPTTSPVFVTTGSLGGIMFSLAVIFDGLVMPETVSRILNTGAADGSAEAFFVVITHHTAIQFFSIALILFMVTLFLISFFLRSSNLIGGFISWFGMILGGLGTVGYLTGFFGYNWENFPLSGLAIMLIYVWLIGFGIAIWRSTPDKIVVQDADG